MGPICEKVSSPFSSQLGTGIGLKALELLLLRGVLVIGEEEKVCLLLMGPPMAPPSW